MDSFLRLRMSVFGFVLVVLGSVNVVSQTTGYTYARGIAINHSQVANTDQTDFPVLISGTFPYLATVANGGKVQNANGYDIVFTSDAAGQNKLDHEIDSYDPTSGTASFWVRMPTLSHTTDTQIFVWYGNSAVSTSQQNKAGVWQNGYVAVWHLGNSTALTVADSEGANNATVSNNVTAGSGVIGEAANLGAGASDYLRVASSTSYKPTSMLSLEAWTNPRSSGWYYWGNVISLDYHATSSWTAPYSSYGLYLNSSSTNVSFSVTTGGVINAVTTPTALPLNAWSHIVATYDGSSQRIYVNGSQSVAGALTGPIDYGNSKDLAIGTCSPYGTTCPWDGLLDEVRISSVARSADWIATEFNNQNIPGEFAFVCANEANNSQPSPCTVPQLLTPQIQSITPTSGPINAQVTVTGAGFGAVRGAGTVSFGGSNATVVSWSDKKVVATVPGNAVSGAVVVTAGGVQSNNNLSFALIAPQITAISPTTGPINTQVTINGSGFGATQGTSTISFGGATASVVSWSDTQIITNVPWNGVSGAVVVTIAGVISNNNFSFTIPPPHIDSISPTSGVAGTQVTITGTGFRSSSGGAVFFSVITED